MPACSAARFAASAASSRFHDSRTAASSAAAGMPASAPDKAERDHVGPAPRDALRRLLERSGHEARAGSLEHVGHVAFVRVADHDARRRQRDLVGEAVDVLPVDREQQVEAVVERCHGRSRETHAAPPPRRRGSAARWCAPSCRTAPPSQRRRASSVPAVITPLPPLPASAIERLAGAPPARACRAFAPAVFLIAAACTASLLHVRFAQ